MVLGGPEADQRPPLELERRDSIADGLGRLRRGGPDGLAKLLQGRPCLVRYGSEEGV
jgi:hypothetical protein